MTKLDPLLSTTPDRSAAAVSEDELAGDVIVTVDGDDPPDSLATSAVEAVIQVLADEDGPAEVAAEVDQPDGDVSPSSVPVDGVVEEVPRDCFYEVVTGDSAISIAQKLGVTVEDLEALNSNLDRLSIGSVLEIPCDVEPPSLAAEQLADGEFVSPNPIPVVDRSSSITVASEQLAFVVSTGMVDGRAVIFVDQFDRATGELRATSEIGDFVGCDGVVDVSFVPGTTVDALPVTCVASGQRGTFDVFSGRAVFSSGITVLIANATITGGVASALSASLDNEYSVFEAVNGNEPNLSESILYFGPDQEEATTDLADLLGIENVEPMTSPLPIDSTEQFGPDNLDILIVLGDDWNPRGVGTTEPD